MTKKVVLKEGIKISDKVTATASLSPEMYRREYERYKQIYFENDSRTENLCFAYIFLQLYVENHLHYFLNFLIGTAFGREPRISDWRERDYVVDNKSQEKGKLRKFKKYLLSIGLVSDEGLFEEIEKDFSYLSQRRNDIAHGHFIATYYSNVGIKESPTRSFLNRQEFSECRKTADNLANNWNQLLSILQSKNLSGLPSKHFLEDCKFKVF